MFTDGSGDHSGSLCLCFVNDDFSHDAAVLIIQMADRLIQKQEVERLAERPDKKRRAVAVRKIAYRLSHLFYLRSPVVRRMIRFLFSFFASGEVILQLHIFKSGQFGEDA